jgi:hypothetical protein
MPIIFELNEMKYQALLSPGAVIAMQEETRKVYPEILRGMIGEGERPGDPMDVLAFCRACLLHAWPGLTTEQLWNALQMSNLTHYNAGMVKLLALARALLEIDAPLSTEEGEQLKNAPTPIRRFPGRSKSGVGVVSPGTCTASSAFATQPCAGPSPCAITRI